MSVWSVHIAEDRPLLPDLIDALGEAGAVVRLSGALRSVQLVAAPGADPVKLQGPAWLVDAHYRAHPGSVALFGVVSWVDQGQPRMAAGRLQDAISGGVDALVTPLEAAAPAAPQPKPKAEKRRAGPAKKRSRDEQVQAAAIDVSDALPATPEPAPAPTKSQGGWGAAVKASKKPRMGAPTPDELGFEAAPDLEAGDILIHPRFGRCRVSRPAVNNKVKVRRPIGGLVDLHLKALKFRRQPDEDGKRVFRLEI